MQITTNGTTRTIPDDEPVFLIRGQDAVGGAAVRAWADLASAAGADPDILRSALDHADKMDAWPKKKVADLPATSTFCGFAVADDGTVQGALPDDLTDVRHSGQLKAAGYDVHCARLDEDADPETAACWRPVPPRGDGWTLAWKAQDEDGWNTVWWRPTAQKRLEKLATMVLGLGLVCTGGKVVKDYARECLGITTVATGG
ncbi:hypothetical protein ABMY26_07135 (plasmid) [Azospirillum sp. HJ39]|uniref:hypothetical protein n=1 Tax=Azospirillum sp. HJ39 TaxID=3159496 RepID=UPI003557E861